MPLSLGHHSPCSTQELCGNEQAERTEVRDSTTPLGPQLPRKGITGAQLSCLLCLLSLMGPGWDTSSISQVQGNLRCTSTDVTPGWATSMGHNPQLS